MMWKIYKVMRWQCLVSSVLSRRAQFLVDETRGHRAIDIKQSFAFLHRYHVAAPDFVEHRLRGNDRTRSHHVRRRQGGNGQHICITITIAMM